MACQTVLKIMLLNQWQSSLQLHFVWQWHIFGLLMLKKNYYRWSSTSGHSTFVQPALSYVINSQPKSSFCTLNSNFCTQLIYYHFKLSHSGNVKLSPKLYFVSTKCQKGQSQWPHGLRHGSAVAHSLGLQVWILPGACMSVSCVCCALSD
jgi:hypothetical protein